MRTNISDHLPFKLQVLSLIEAKLIALSDTLGTEIVRQLAKVWIQLFSAVQGRRWWSKVHVLKNTLTLGF